MLIVLICICFQQEAFLQDAVPSKLQFTSKQKNRVSIDSVYYYSFNAIDSSGHSISYAADGLPAWLKFDAANHLISGKPIKPGQYRIHIVASTADTAVHQRFMLTVYNKKTINILALGNSITNGTDKYNSFRRPLWQLLHQGNYNVDMIGSWSLHHMGGEVPDPDFDMDHDGHSGWKASDILHQPDWDKQRGNIHDWILSYTPDIVLLELGTNEVFQCIAVKDAMRTISSVIDVIRKKNPRVKIFVAQIPPLGKQWSNKALCGNKVTYREALINFNKKVKVLAAKKNTATSKVIIVYQYSGINPATDMYDDIHPNANGERKMAERWYKAVKPFLTKLK